VEDARENVKVGDKSGGKRRRLLHEFALPAITQTLQVLPIRLEY